MSRVEVCTSLLPGNRRDRARGIVGKLAPSRRRKAAGHQRNGAAATATAAVCISLAVLACTSIAAQGQSNVVAVPPIVGPVHPGTAILDSMGIFAGETIPTDRSAHPGTALLDSIGISAGATVRDPVIRGNAVAASTVTRK